jgi:hypothetical protein
MGIEEFDNAANRGVDLTVRRNFPVDLWMSQLETS